MNEIRRTLLDMSELGNRDRKDLAAYVQLIKAGAKIGEIAFGILAFVGLITLGTHLKVATLVTGVCGYFASREIFQVGKNLEQMFDGNFVQRAMCTTNEENFINVLTHDTRILKEFNKIFAQGLSRI